MAVTQCPVGNSWSMDCGWHAGRRSPRGSIGWALRRLGGRKRGAWGRRVRLPRAVSCSLWTPQRFCRPLLLSMPKVVCRASPAGRRPQLGTGSPTGNDERRTEVVQDVQDLEDEEEDEEGAELGADEPQPEFELYFEEVEEDNLATSVAADPVHTPPPAVERGGPVWSWAAAGAVAMLLYMSVWRWLFGSHRRKRRGRESLPDTEDMVKGLLAGQDSEPVEWVNMSFRKIWRVYQRGLERWVTRLLQPVFDGVVEKGNVPPIVQGLKIMEIAFDHEAPRFSNLRRRSSRKDSDLNAVVDVRYTGGMRMLLGLEVGGGRWRLKVPVLVSDLDLESALWFKVRLAPLAPYIGTLSFAFVAPPNIQVQLAPYNRVRLMRTPGLQNFLTSFLTEDLPGMMVLPRRLEVNIPPAVTAVAEAAVGRDAVMRAVASAVLQADALEYSLQAALPLGPQKPAGGVSLPESFQGELTVKLQEGRDLPVWGFPWQSNPFCRLVLGKQALMSKKENETSWKGSFKAPLWNQEFELLIEDLETQVLEVFIMDSHMTARPDVGKVVFPLQRLRPDECLSVWLPVLPINAGQKAQGELKLDLTYRPFQDDTYDSGYREAEAFQQELQTITDVKSAAAATSRAGAAASAAFEAVAMARAAAARAANRAQKAAMKAANIALTGSRDGEEEAYDDDDDEEEEEYDSDEDDLDWDPDTYEPAEIEVKTADSDVYQRLRVGDEQEYVEDAEESWDVEGVEEVEPRTVVENEEELAVAAAVSEASAALSRYEKDILQEVKTELGDDSPELIAAVEIVDEEFVENAERGNVVVASIGDASTADMEDQADNGKAAASSPKDEHALRSQNGSLKMFEDDEEGWMDSQSYGFDGGYETGSMDGDQLAVREQFAWRPLVPASTANQVQETAATSAAGSAIVDGSYATQLDSDGNGHADAESGQMRLGTSHEVHRAATNGLASPTDAPSESPALDKVKAGSRAPDATGTRALQQSKPSTQDIGPGMATTSNSFGQSHSSLESDANGTASGGELPADRESLPEDILPLVSANVERKRKREDEPQRKGLWWSILRRVGRKPDEEGRSEGSKSNGELVKAEGVGPEQQPAWWSRAASLVARRLQDSTTDKELRRPQKKRRGSKGPKLGKPRTRKTPTNLSTVVVPKEVPLEDIAREVVRMKEKNSEQEEERLDRMYNEAVEQSDRKWVMLLFFLCAVSVGLLTIVAYRLDQFP